MNKNPLKFFILLFTLFGGVIALAETSHVLSRVNTAQRKKIAYVCHLSTGIEDITTRISLDLETFFMEVELAEGTVIKGFASSTFHPKNGITSFFLQGGTEPRAQKLLLSIRNEGEWAEFRRAYGAYAFVCK